MQAAEISTIGKPAARPRSLYRDVTLALVVLVSVVSVAVSLLSYFYLSHDAEARYQDKSREYSVYLREALEWPLWNMDDELIGQIGRAFASNEEIALLDIRDDQQRVVFHHEKKSGGDLIRRTIGIQHNGQTIGNVEVGLTQSAYKEREHQLLIISLSTMALLIAALFLLTRWLMARALRKPIQDLVGATNAMVAGEYGRVELTNKYSEFTPILYGFETMSAAVASREDSLQRINTQLTEEIGVRKRAEELLRQSEERWQFALEGAGDGVWDWDVQTNRTMFSRRWKEMLGYAENEFEDTYEAWRQHVHPDDVARVMGAMQDYFSGKAEGYRVEFRMRCKDDSWKWILARGMVVGRDAQGKPLRMIGTHADISQRKHWEEELTRYKDHLEEQVEQRTADLLLARNAAETANQAKSAFLASMSHELRTPLNAILGFSNMMRRDPQLQEGQRQNLDIINRSGEHLLTLINDVLDMAKIEAGRVQLEESAFDLGGMVRDVTDMMQIRAREKGLQLLIDQSSLFPRYIVADEARLRQVLINLIGNAVKFTTQGGVTVRLGSKRNERAHLVIEVEDSGPGISPQDQKVIFEPFVQLGEQGLNKGTGLGLTITRQFVQLMGGRISVQSTMGKGSIFRVELPLKEAAEKDIANSGAMPSGEVVGLAPGQPEYRVLIVEDQRDNQLLLSKLMEVVDVQYKIAENGEQAIRLFQDWQPQLIWMDRRMPVMDGIEAAKHIRRLPGGKEIKIVAVTASAFQEQRAEMLNAGMDDFVRKPFRSSEIYDCMSRQLGLQYRYAGTPEAETQAESVALTPEMLAVLPEALRSDLRAALESLESERIAAVLIEIARYDAVLQKALAQHIDNFDYPTILNALQANQHA